MSPGTQNILHTKSNEPGHHQQDKNQLEINIKKIIQRRTNRNNKPSKINNGTKAKKSTTTRKRRWNRNTIEAKSTVKLLENLSNQMVKSKDVEQSIVNADDIKLNRKKEYKK